MRPELSLLVWAVVLTFVLVLIAVQGAMMQVGFPTLASNREGFPELKGWAGRAQRAHRNLLENLILFAALVIVAVLTNKTNSTTLLGAQLFFWARIVHAAVYIAGIPYVRTLTWFVSIAGLILIFLQVV